MISKEGLLYIVDDSMELRLAIADKLSLSEQTSWITTEGFDHGDDLCSLLSRAMKLPDLILMDTEMDTVDFFTGKVLKKHAAGYLVCKEIIKEYGNSIPIVGMSMDPDYRELWQSAGANQFICKTILSSFLKDGLLTYLEPRYLE